MSSRPSAAMPVQPRVSSFFTPLPITDVIIDGGFWGRVQLKNREAIIPHCDNSLERVGWIENFRAAARGTLANDRTGTVFTDSEIYKTMEAMAWEIGRSSSPELVERLKQLVEIVGAVQHDDGYLNTYFGWDGGPERYSDIDRSHELYCSGHLLQAAVAFMRTAGLEEFGQIAIKLADHICSVFGEDGRQAVPGHPEIETALVELYRETGQRRYLDQAKLFIDRRGHHTLEDTMYRGRDQYQDGTPVRDSTVLVGHAVRALYLAAGAIDVAVETGDQLLFDRVRAQYDRTLERRTYLTGGMGSNHHGESFGDDFELPSERAYCEACASVASTQLAWRLLLATGDVKYADVMERTLHNSMLAAVSQDGTSFFYVNPLQRRHPGIQPEEGMSLRRTDGMRASWYTTSCCPTNLARFYASLSGYLATADDTGVQLHLYAGGTVRASVGGAPVALEVTTAYPQEGSIRIRVTETPDRSWKLRLRVPAWAATASLVENGEVRSVAPGYLDIDRAWQVGDEIELVLDMQPRFVFPDARVDSIRDSVAIERGPMVYCVESPDQPELDLDTLRLDLSAAVADDGILRELDDSFILSAKGKTWSTPLGEWPYSATQSDLGETTDVKVTLIPYYLWANRGSSTMRLWVPIA